MNTHLARRWPLLSMLALASVATGDGKVSRLPDFIRKTLRVALPVTTTSTNTRWVLTRFVAAGTSPGGGDGA